MIENGMLTGSLHEANAARNQAILSGIGRHAKDSFLTLLQTDPAAAIVCSVPKWTVADALIEYATYNEGQTQSLAEFIVAAARGDDVKTRAELILSVAAEKHAELEVLRAQDNDL